MIIVLRMSLDSRPSGGDMYTTFNIQPALGLRTIPFTISINISPLTGRVS